jgi:2-methylisocitrate lyase-like PEP mutase family enzyme
VANRLSHEDPDFLIIARTNAVHEASFAEAVRCGNAYAGAEADVIMACPRTPEEARQLPKELHKPVVFRLSSAGDRPALTPQELYALGYPPAIEPQTGLTMAYGAMCTAYLELKKKGRISGDPAEICMLRDEIYELVDLPEYWELESRTVET